MSIRDEFSKELNDSFPDADVNGVLAILRDVLTAHGLQIVPVEPTDEMANRGMSQPAMITAAGPFVVVKAVYEDMIKAAPNPLAEADGEDG